MKNQILLIFAILILSSCASSKKAIKQGDYNSAIELAYKKLLKNPKNQEEMVNLELAYNIAQEADLRQIEFLKKEGNPENYDQIYSLYMAIRRRQTRVTSLPPLFLVVNDRYVVLQTFEVNAKRQEVLINNLGAFASGVYLKKIQTETGVSYCKIIKL